MYNCGKKLVGYTQMLVHMPTQINKWIDNPKSYIVFLYAFMPSQKQAPEITS